MGNDKDRDSGLDEEGPQSMGPLAGPDPEQTSETNEHDTKEDDVREQIRATPNE
jgi:hypothetical protein